MSFLTPPPPQLVLTLSSGDLLRVHLSSPFRGGWVRVKGKRGRGGIRVCMRMAPQPQKGNFLCLEV